MCQYYLGCILLIISLFVTPTCLGSVTNHNLSLDNVRLYHDIIYGHGLYYGAPNLTDLDSNNFKTVLFKNQTSKLWLVQFYNSWCGNCHRFAPTWKALASNVFGWRKIVKIGVVDCANDDNFYLCFDLDTLNNPVVKLFPPNSKKNFKGELIQGNEVDEFVDSIAYNLKVLKKENDYINYNPLTYDSLDEGLWDGLPSHVKNLVLVFEPEQSLVGLKLALDFSLLKVVNVRLVDPQNKKLKKAVGILEGSPKVVVIERSLKVHELNVEHFTRENLYKALRIFLKTKGVEVPVLSSISFKPPEINVGDIIVIRTNDIVEKYSVLQNSYSKVFQSDLEAAIHYTFTQEMLHHENFIKKYLETLRDFSGVLMKYFPIQNKGREFLKEFHREVVGDGVWVTNKEVNATFHRLFNKYDPFLPVNGFFNCKGSKLKYRNYPCGMWTLFHTLTVHSALNNRDKPFQGPEVLNAIKKFMGYIYHCGDCVDHFLKMAKSIPEKVKSEDDSVLWLWDAHNQANARLKDKPSSDPEHPKVQFPSKNHCPPCHNQDGSFNKTEVLKFLKHMYTNIIYPTKDDFVLYKSKLN